MRKSLYSLRVPCVIGLSFFTGYSYAKMHKTEMLKSEPPKISAVPLLPLKQNIVEKTVVLIDWDNCLCDSMPRTYKRLKLVSIELKRRHPDFDISDEKINLPWTAEFSTHMRNLFGDRYAAEAGELYTEFMHHSGLPPRVPFEGSDEFLQALNVAEIPFAIVTNGNKKNVIHCFAEFGWTQLLNNVSIVSVDEVSTRNKPDPFHFLMALTTLNLDLAAGDIEHVIIIGDGIDSDMLGSLKLADEMEKYGITVSAVWVNHNRKVKCHLNTVNSFDEACELIGLKSTVARLT
jgi:FMN phosphatase YigB (HAD superfamily)